QSPRPRGDETHPAHFEPPPTVAEPPPPPQRLPPPPRKAFPPPPAAAARIAPQDQGRATAPAPDTHRRIDASARPECPSGALAPSRARGRRRTVALAQEPRSDGAPMPALRSAPPRQARQDAPPSAG